MRKNGIRLLLLLAVVIGAAAVVQDLHFDNTLGSTRAAVYGVDDDLGALNGKLSDFRSAQTAYLASGQDPAFWMRRASELADDVTAALGRLRTSATSAESNTRIEAASVAFASLVESDTRARQAVVNGQASAAGEAILTEGAGIMQRIASELGAVRSAELAAAEREMTRVGQLRVGVTGGAIAAVLLLMFIAVKFSPQPQVSAAASMAQMLRDLPPPVKSPLATQNGNGSTTAAATPVAKPASNPMAPVPALSVNLPETAELCGDLARVMDGSDVPALLARTAKLLEASGVIVWMADSSGHRLEPMLTHGYNDKVLQRLGTLPVDADNVTSLAFRSRRSQQVNGSGSSGAIAIPLVTASGCTGVLAAEVKETKLAPDAVAVARIIAAQFATIIAPVDEGVQSRAAEA